MTWEELCEYAKDKAPFCQYNNTCIQFMGGLWFDIDKKIYIGTEMLAENISYSDMKIIIHILWAKKIKDDLKVKIKKDSIAKELLYFIFGDLFWCWLIIICFVVYPLIWYYYGE